MRKIKGTASNHSTVHMQMQNQISGHVNRDMEKNGKSIVNVNDGKRQLLVKLGSAFRAKSYFAFGLWFRFRFRFLFLFWFWFGFGFDSRRHEEISFYIQWNT